MIVKKILNGSTYIDAKDGRKFVWTGATGWAVRNDKNQLIDIFSTRWAALAEVKMLTDKAKKIIQ